MKASLFRFLITVGMLALTLVATTLSERRKSEALLHPLDTIPRQIEGWQADVDGAIDEETLNVLGATSYLSRNYHKQTATIDFFVAYYAKQRSGESIHSPKNCLPGSGWEIWKYGTAQIPVGNELVTINRDSIEHSGSRSVMYYWYQSKRQIIASEYLGKFLLMRDALLAGYTSGSIVRIVVADQPSADLEAQHFASMMIPHLRYCYGQDVQATDFKVPQN